MRATAAETTGLRTKRLAPPLLTTKLHPPPGRAQTVARDRLVERLHAGPGTKLTVVAAPAGYGKTTLLGAWREAEARRRPVAWVTLDDRDNDPVVLWSYALEALRRVCPELKVRLSPETVGPARNLELVLPQLVNELTALGDAALVLDDFHLLSSGPARESVAWFIEHAPATFQLVLGTRNEPGLPLASLRAHGALLELRADELGFTPSEADVLLNERLGLGLDRRDVDDLVERTEGWPAGLYLAALSLQGVQDRHLFATRFGGGNRHVVDFLVDEVLEAHDPAMQSLMLRSSVLDRMCGRLCDALLEQEGSAAQLGALSRTNLFLVPLDDHGEWYRFHHLFAQLLRVELEHREPGAAAALHRRAYAWHRDHGSIDEAIRHALAAGAFGEASDAIVGAWLWMISVGRHATVLAWLDSFPPQLSRQDPQLLLMRAWLCSLAGDREQAASARAALDSLRWPDGDPLPDGSSSLEASLATLRAAFPWGDVGSAYANAVRATDLQAQDAPLRSAAVWARGMACYYHGDLDEADRWFDEAVRAGTLAGRWLVTASGLAYRSLIAGELGELDEQRALADAAGGVVQENGLEGICGEVHVSVGAALTAQGHPEQALPHLERGVTVLRSVGQPHDVAMALMRYAAALGAAGRHVAATQAIAKARAAIKDCRDPGVLTEWVRALDRRPRARRRDAQLSERELVVLRMLKGPLSERDIGRELYLSYNTIHSHTRSIYRKLGVSSRKQAVQRALSLGVL